MAQMLERKADANRQAGSQVKCAAIDSINREEVQHGVCSSERTGVDRVMAMFRTSVPPKFSAVAQEGTDHSNGNQDVAKDFAR
jgi:hypothetical protein